MPNKNIITEFKDADRYSDELTGAQIPFIMEELFERRVVRFTDMNKLLKFICTYSDFILAYKQNGNKMELQFKNSEISYLFIIEDDDNKCKLKGNN